MINFKIDDNKDDKEVRVLFEKDKNGNLYIKGYISSPISSYYLLTLTVDGYLDRCNHIPSYFGFKLNDDGQIELK